MFLLFVGRVMKEIHSKIEDIRNILHKHGNKLNNHEIQIKLSDSRLDILNEHREKHGNEIIIIQAKQDHMLEATIELSTTIKGLTQKITTLFTIKNMVIGGFLTLTAIIGVIIGVLKLISDYYK